MFCCLESEKGSPGRRLKTSAGKSRGSKQELSCFREARVPRFNNKKKLLSRLLSKQRTLYGYRPRQVPHPLKNVTSDTSIFYVALTGESTICAALVPPQSDFPPACCSHASTFLASPQWSPKCSPLDEPMTLSIADKVRLPPSACPTSR